jgi:hypothetical protein
MKNMDLKDIFIINKIRYDVLILYERVLLYIIFIRNFIVVYFNVSSTKLNAHARLSRYVWCGCYTASMML